MRKLFVTLAVLTLPMAVVVAKDDKKGAPVLAFKMKDIDGKDVDLSTYKGKVVMFVNVASKCGYTKQYKQLQELHDKYAEKGLVLIGVPANEFLAQEPGTDAEIKEFCTSKFGVKFPMLAKVVVKGTGMCPLYEHLTSAKTNPKHGGAIKWNFTKFLISKEGEIVNRFEPGVRPDAKEVTSAIESELKK